MEPGRDDPGVVENQQVILARSSSRSNAGKSRNERSQKPPSRKERCNSLLSERRSSGCWAIKPAGRSK